MPLPIARVTMGRWDELYWTALKKAIQGGKNLLEFGCGTGRLAGNIRKLNIHYTGVDSSRDLIIAAKKNHPDLSNNFILINGPVLPFADKAFDVCILSCDARQLDAKLFSELFRVLTPGGTLVSRVQGSAGVNTAGVGEESFQENTSLELLSRFGEIVCLRNIGADATSTRKPEQGPSMTLHDDILIKIKKGD